MRYLPRSPGLGGTLIMNDDNPHPHALLVSSDVTRNTFITSSWPNYSLIDVLLDHACIYAGLVHACMMFNCSHNYDT